MEHAAYPIFQDPQFLRDHLRSEIAFFHPRCIDPEGGFFHYLDDDGVVYDAASRHLVNSARMVFCYTLAWRIDGRVDYRNAIEHGLAFIDQRHRQPSGAHAWVLEKGIPADCIQHCYGLAFVMLAQAHALRVGISGAGAGLKQVFGRMEALFWSEMDGLYADEASSCGKLSVYRGQNANMHSCEALIAAFEASGEVEYLHRAERIARNITLGQAALAGGWIWEHYHQDWSIDWEYNLDDPENMFRPWGFQPGHMTEWAKLLLLMMRHGAYLLHGSDWLLPRAEELFNAAVDNAWDATHGGLFYGLAPDMTVCDSDKYFWVQAETLAAAALLGQSTGQKKYWDWYERIWRYSWDHMIDHCHGGWHRVLSRQNTQYGRLKPPYGKTDFYHPMGACLEALWATGAPLP